MWALRRVAASAWVELCVWSVWLVVVVGSLVLPIYLGLSFLLARDCQPNILFTLPRGSLTGLVNLQDEKSQGWLVKSYFWQCIMTILLDGPKAALL